MDALFDRYVHTTDVHIRQMCTYDRCAHTYVLVFIPYAAHKKLMFHTPVISESLTSQGTTIWKLVCTPALPKEKESYSQLSVSCVIQLKKL